MLSFLIMFHCFFAWGKIEVTPTEKVNEEIVFTDDLEFENLDLAVSRQLKSFGRTSLSGKIQYGDDQYSKSILKDSLIHFQALTDQYKRCKMNQSLDVCQADLNTSLNRDFNLYRPIPKKEEQGYGQPLKRTLFTVYFSPDFKGSRVPTERYNNPIYRMPTESSLRGKTREEIDFMGALTGKGLELFWVEESLFDIYILHVEGGGRLKIKNDDGTEEKVYLSYAGSNGRKFEFISRYMIQQGHLTAREASIDNQKLFIEQNPHLAREIFASSPSYIYFKQTKDEPLGVQNIPLTEGRSLAIDTRTYKHIGVLNFIRTTHGSKDEAQRVIQKTFSRFFVSQDTGGALRGNARVDLYFGYGDDAATAAHNTKSMGEQIFMIKKPKSSSKISN